MSLSQPINVLFGNDWPQILGPHRNGQSAAPANFSVPWKQPQLQPKWSLVVGSGFAGVAVAQGKVLVVHRVGNSEILQAVDLQTGQPAWSRPWAATYTCSINSDSGPRCVPTVVGDKVICYGAAGDLVCASLSDGKIHWALPVRREYKADDGYFGAGSSPLVIDDLVIVNVGGQLGGIVAFELETGKQKWAATNYDASYASPIAARSQGRPVLLVVTRLHAVVLDPKDGKVLDEIGFGARGPTVNAATPISIGNEQYLLTASYGVGATAIDLTSGKIRELYRGNELLSSQYNTPITIGSNVIGIDGREDLGPAALRAFDPLKQTEIWRQDDYGTANLIAVGANVLAVSLDGTVRLIDGTAKAYRELAASSLPPGTYRALPALVGKQLVVRSSSESGQGKVHCFELP